MAKWPNKTTQTGRFDGVSLEDLTVFCSDFVTKTGKMYSIFVTKNSKI